MSKYTKQAVDVLQSIANMNQGSYRIMQRALKICINRAGGALGGAAGAQFTELYHPQEFMMEAVEQMLKEDDDAEKNINGNAVVGHKEVEAGRVVSIARGIHEKKST